MDEREALFPPDLLPLFNDTFVASFDLCEEYVGRLALGVLQATGLELACLQESTVEQAVSRAGLAGEVARVPAAWLLKTSAARGSVSMRTATNGALLDRAKESAEGFLAAADPNEMLRAQEELDARCLPSYAIAALAAANYPPVLRGHTSGEQALFTAEGISAWLRYFSNDNPLYAISNSVGALAVEQVLGEGDVAILEIGGGLGSGADALLRRLVENARLRQLSAYRFTELSPLFLKRAQRNLSARYPSCPFVFSALDIDLPFAAQGVAPDAHSLVYGSNVLHVARDLANTLAELRRALKPGGMLVMSECMRPFTDEPLHVEFVFNLLGSFRNPVLVPEWRPNGGFLTPEQWRQALAANGFSDICIVPDIAAIRDHYPSISVAAIVARRA